MWVLAANMIVDTWKTFFIKMAEQWIDQKMRAPKDPIYKLLFTSNNIDRNQSAVGFLLN